MSKQTQNRIRELRKKAKLSQQALADQIGVFRNTISNWETGYSQISLENAKNVAEYFGVTIDYLLGSESDQT
ncbi:MULTISPECIES: helix-turn-helix transcriptional regulator [Streptococcus]|uniref:XRE family transcriptional regulator n=2 Tax=Streptococcus mitis group TaxID=3409772 RepID=A0A387AZN5_9STRE|nr:MULTISPECIES: helix-turn-helix transcriptional regulator [Streptococcus]AYF95018.1 XRE family transcriptional regulator [Streptococcus gwangjuense]KEQ34368.1 helix-turn-helix family protein [Streptococcus mitis]MDB0074487.1 helix-turn-helix domain-containing protein [Streptococcus gwangjuense]MDB0075155.1 helix-turn-helix domain-containing protein [Streptococcus gwangjuense]MDB0075964.1 helix-turn-helix domain-containing protein [Streptococcus gwangjuense]